MKTALVMRQMLDLVMCDAVARGLVPATASAHILRHIFAHNYPAEYTGDVIGLETLLEHTSLDTTGIYRQPSIEQLSTCVEQIRQSAYKD
jgi:site-specific recombinase XerD